MLSILTNASIASIGGPKHPSVASIWWGVTEPLVGERVFQLYRSSKYVPSTEYYETPILLTEITTIPNEMSWSFKDSTPDLKDNFRQYYYQVKMTIRGEVEIESKWFTWDSMFQVHEYEILRLHELLFHYDTGSPIFLYSERTENPLHCPFCWNATLQRPQPLEECPNCLKTGRVKPYYDPILIWIEMDVDNKVAIVQDHGELHPNKKTIRLSGLPKIKPRDLLQDPFTGKFFIIETVNNIGRTYAPVLQIAAIDMEPTQEDIYRYLTISDSMRASLHEQMAAITDERRH